MPPIGLGLAVAMGALQGVTEFLPVSSSGHVAALALLAGVEDLPLSTVIVVHLGTVIATVGVLGQDIWHLTRATLRGLGSPRQFLETDEGRTVGGVVLATVPTGVIGIGLLAAGAVDSATHVPLIIAAGWVASAAILWTTRGRAGERSTLGIGACLLVGLAQGAAVLPGVSRSGTTIAVAMALGMRPDDAFKFSFLLLLPATIGAALLELTRPQALAITAETWVAGGVAMVTGYAALLLLRRMTTQGKLWAFSLYLVPAACGLGAWSVLS